MVTAAVMRVVAPTSALATNGSRSRVWGVNIWLGIGISVVGESAGAA